MQLRPTRLRPGEPNPRANVTPTGHQVRFSVIPGGSKQSSRGGLPSRSVLVGETPDKDGADSCDSWGWRLTIKWKVIWTSIGSG
jgi:hypothetical protein